MNRPIPPQAISLIRKYEGLRLFAYGDPGTGGEPWTIGYGHTGGVYKGDTISASEAERILELDLLKFGKGVESLIRSPILLNDNQFSALISFSFNLGLERLRQSALLANLNSGNLEAAGKAFLHWTHAGGKELPGLVKRRKEESELFLTPMPVLIAQETSNGN